eukprot:TRINITY_DN6981_c0_g1_i1.p1 TRINITY_DN6981_c0_g1~~TRINITY_DN6981_c0_g1_i1.p1  ORF type:complete len:847 (+),score=116.64 TRINITY_DN6981_c0_g1_i1:54-2543(+)
MQGTALTILLFATVPWACLSSNNSSNATNASNHSGNAANASNISGNATNASHKPINGSTPAPGPAGNNSVQCAATEMVCPTIGFDASGQPTHGQACAAKPADGSGMCPQICGTGAQLCGSPPASFCVPSAEGCPKMPQMCQGDTPQMCFITNFDDKGDMVSFEDKCVANGTACPCGAKSKACTEDGYSFCIPEALSCPIKCTEEQRECMQTSFTPTGELDLSAGMEITCVAKDAACSCGTNAILCSETNPEYGKFEWCEPKTIDGTANSCPVQCTADQKMCTELVFDDSGNVINFKDTCVAADASCPCGAQSNKCTDDLGEYCLPKSFGSCPVMCTADQEYCFVDSYDSAGEWTGTQESCVATGGTCDCSKGTNAKSCTFSDPMSDKSWTECLFKDEYCPVACSSGQVQCPEVENFNSDGEIVSVTTPTDACASKLSDCKCGTEAQRCSEGEFAWCQPKSFGCPANCQSGTKECYVDNFNASGSFSSSKARCVKEEEPCPCGTNAKKCADGMCIPKTEECDCKATEKPCIVADYANDGSVSLFKSVCVASNTQCPCGKNSKLCRGILEGDDSYCIPKGFKDGKGGECPQPCTPKEVADGNMTCVQTNLDTNGEFVSQVIKCVQKGNCLPGRNMKKCSSGAVISVKDKCTSLYPVSNSTSGASEDQTAKLKFDLDSNKSDAEAAKEAASMMVAMSSVLQIPPDLRTTLAIKAPKKKRRLSGGSSKKTVTLEIKNSGGVAVTPQRVANKAADMIKKKSPQMTKALKRVGTARTDGVLTAVSRKKTSAQKEKTPLAPSPTMAPTTENLISDAPAGAQPTAVLFFLACALTLG